MINLTVVMIEQQLHLKSNHFLHYTLTSLSHHIVLTLQVRSMLTGEADMTTLVMSAERLLTEGDAIYAVKKLASAAGL